MISLAAFSIHRFLNYGRREVGLVLALLALPVSEVEVVLELVVLLLLVVVEEVLLAGWLEATVLCDCAGCVVVLVVVVVVL